MTDAKRLQAAKAACHSEEARSADVGIRFPPYSHLTFTLNIHIIKNGLHTRCSPWEGFLSVSARPMLIICLSGQKIKGEIMETLLVLAILVLAAFLFIKLVLKTAKGIFKFIVNTVLAFVLLWLTNFFGDPLGIHIAMNFINVAVVGVLGLPGLAILVILQLLV